MMMMHFLKRELSLAGSELIGIVRSHRWIVILSGNVTRINWNWQYTYITANLFRKGRTSLALEWETVTLALWQVRAGFNKGGKSQTTKVLTKVLTKVPMMRRQRCWQRWREWDDKDADKGADDEATQKKTQKFLLRRLQPRVCWASDIRQTT